MKKLLLCVSALLIFSCQDETFNEDVQEYQLSEEAISVLKSFEYDLTTDPYITPEGLVVVEEDMILPYTEEELINLATNKSTSKQRRHSSIASCSNALDIRIRSWETGNRHLGLIDAINAYNNNFSSVNITLVTNSDWDIGVGPRNKSAFNNKNIVASGRLPSNGKVGDRIRVNKDHSFYNSQTRKIWKDIMMHEIGHTIGLRHTGTSDGTYIPNTAGTETKSIMTSGSSRVRNGYFTNNDRTAVNYLYGTNKYCKNF